MEMIDNRYNPEKKPCPNCSEKSVKFQIGCPAIGDSVRMGLKKPDAGFKEVMSKVKEKHKINQLKDRKWGN
jgi:hypothetical protein